MTTFGIVPSAPLSRAAHQGTFHRLYDVREAGRGPRLLRVAAIAGSAAASLMELENAVMAQVRDAGFPVPACEYRDVPQGGVSRGVHLVERAPGESLTALDGEEARMVAALGRVASFLAKLHGIRGSGFGPVSLAGLQGGERQLTGVHERWDEYVLLRLEEHLRSCASQGAITGGEAADIAARFAQARASLRQPPSALLHGDPGSHNFMVDESGVRAVIDWEDALLGDPLFDLASLCTFHPERRHAAILSAYGAVLKPGAEPWNRFWLYFLRIALAKTVHRYRFAYTDRPDRPPASQRIQLALARLGVVP